MVLDSRKIMSDSDDDWFEKDIDDFVVKAQPSNVEHISVATEADVKTPALANNIYNDAGLSFILFN